MAIYTAKNAYFDTIKGIKIHTICTIPVDLELRNLAVIKQKNLKTIDLRLNPKK